MESDGATCISEGVIFMEFLFAVAEKLHGFHKPHENALPVAFNGILENQTYQNPVSRWYTLPSPVPLPSHYFLYQNLKCLKNQVVNIYCSNITQY
jgi:hypothetical protein